MVKEFLILGMDNGIGNGLNLIRNTDAIQVLALKNASEIDFTITISTRLFEFL